MGRLPRYTTSNILDSNDVVDPHLAEIYTLYAVRGGSNKDVKLAQQPTSTRAPYFQPGDLVNRAEHGVDQYTNWLEDIQTEFTFARLIGTIYYKRAENLILETLETSFKLQQGITYVVDLFYWISSTSREGDVFPRTKITGISIDGLEVVKRSYGYIRDGYYRTLPTFGFELLNLNDKRDMEEETQFPPLISDRSMRSPGIKEASTRVVGLGKAISNEAKVTIQLESVMPFSTVPYDPGNYTPISRPYMYNFSFTRAEI